MTESSFDKWPVEIKIVKISSNIVNQDLDTFFITGLMNNEQAASLAKKLSILTTLHIDPERQVISTICTRPKLEDALIIFKKLSKSWRGQYQILMKVLTHEIEEALIA